MRPRLVVTSLVIAAVASPVGPAGSATARSVDRTRPMVAMAPVPGGQQIVAIDARTGETTPITPASEWAIEPSLSPDGGTVAFVHRYVDGRSHPFTSLDVVSVTGGPQLVVYRSPARWLSVSSPAWSPDGSRIAFVCEFPLGAQLCMIGVDGGGMRSVTRLHHHGIDGVTWSPDGKWLAFGNAPDAMTFNFRLSRIRPDGTGLRSIT